MGRWLLFGASLFALVAVGCGGGSAAPASSSSPAVAAKRLVYVDPPDGVGWRLIRNVASTESRVVLDLVPPAGVAGRGVTLHLAADADRVFWVPTAGSSMVTSHPYSGELVNKGGIKLGVLRILVTQKGGAPVAYGGAPLLSVALEGNPTGQPGAIPLTASQGFHLGEGERPEAISVAVGAVQLF